MTNEVAKTQEGAVAAPVEQSSILSAILALAKDPAVDVAKFEGLMALQERMEARQAEAQFNQAFARLALKLPRIKKDGTVEYADRKGSAKPAFKFATFASIDDAIRPLLQEEGFSLSFNSAPRQGDGGGIVVTGTLLHVGGHSRVASIPLALDGSGGKNSIQGMGSTFSYGRRYTTVMLLNLVTEDDDDGVRGGTKFITADQVAELEALLKEVGREEGPFLDRMFGGAVRSFEEIEAGTAFLAVKNTLEGIKAQQQKKGAG